MSFGDHHGSGHRSISLLGISRVVGHTLDPGKHWYVLTKRLCGVRPKEFATSEIFRLFRNEIQSVAPKDLKPATRGCDFNRQPSHLYVVSSFGLCAGLLRQRQFAPDCFLRSEKFASVVDLLNGFELNSDSTSSFGGKSCPSDNGAKEMKILNSRIAELESKIMELENSNSHLTNFLPISPPLAASSPSQSSSDNSGSSAGTSCSFIEETLNSSLGPINTKRAVANHCKGVTADLEGVCEKYHETLACVLGHSFIYGSQEEKEKVSETISEIVNLVLEAKGSKKGLAELLLPGTYQKILDGMRVPDWVLLYFKLKARLPDDAWQTLLNLTQLGKSRVCKLNLHFVHC